MKLTKTKAIIWGATLVTLIGVELKAVEYAENLNGAWIKVHSVPMESCVKSGGINEEDMISGDVVCHIQDFNMEKLLEEK